MSPHHALDLELAMIRDLVRRLALFDQIMTLEDAKRIRDIALELIKLSHGIVRKAAA